MEIWKDVPGYEFYYQVSNLGNVKSLIGKGRTLKPRNSNNYYRVALFLDGQRKDYLIHQLVAMAFLGHKIDGHEKVVDHINNIKNDNRLSNLRIITQRENVYTHYVGKSKYKGVSFNSGKWMSRIHVKGVRKYLGIFKTEIEANNAYTDFCNKNKINY